VFIIETADEAAWAPMAAPVLEIDLGRQLKQLRREPEWSGGQNAKTNVTVRALVSLSG
jgi:hypothetical protein